MEYHQLTAEDDSQEQCLSPPELDFGSFEGLQQLVLFTVQHVSTAGHCFSLLGL